MKTGPEGGFSAYAPDLPGCVAAASTLAELRTLVEEAIEFHVEGMRLHGETVPEPSSLAENVGRCVVLPNGIARINHQFTFAFE